MPWKELVALDLRNEMIEDYLFHDYTITELGLKYKISRKTVYKWIERHEELGHEGLKEFPRTPHNCPNETTKEIVQEILNMKTLKMHWGPKKILARLRDVRPNTKWPADSTGHDILKRYGLVKTRKYRQRTPAYTKPFLHCDAPNMVWSADYKGQFAMGNGNRCYPLTISDNYSRYLLLCQGLAHPKYEQTKAGFEWAFRTYGLPQAIRTDNGAPFASNGLGGLSRLSVWFIKLGISPERIMTGHPEQNGRHERMHRTLKKCTASPPERNIREQQKAFDEFRDEYNYERPHEALGQKTPASFYHSSFKQFPGRIPTVEYDSGVTSRSVHNRGEIRWKAQRIFLSEALIGERVGLFQTNDGVWELKYGFYPLGLIDERIMKIKRY